MSRCRCLCAGVARGDLYGRFCRGADLVRLVSSFVPCAAALRGGRPLRYCARCRCWLGRFRTLCRLCGFGCLCCSCCAAVLISAGSAAACLRYLCGLGGLRTVCGSRLVRGCRHFCGRCAARGGVLAAGGMMCRPCRLRALWGLLGGSWWVLISSAGLAASSALGAGVALRVVCPLPVLSSFLPS